MTERPSTPIPAGWYPDPRGTPQRRWWDGSAWTHALEPLAATPAWANLPGPVVNRAPSPSAPTVKRAIVDNAEAEQPAIAAASTPSTANAGFPTRRQLRDAEATRAMQKQLTEPTPETPVYAIGAAGSLRAAVSAATPRVVSTAAAASISEAPVHTTGSSMSSAKTEAGGPYSPTHTFTPTPSPARPAAAIAAPAAAPAETPAVTEAPESVADAAPEAAPIAVAPVVAAPDAAPVTAPVSAAPAAAAPVAAAPVAAAPVAAPVAAAPVAAAAVAAAPVAAAPVATPAPAAPKAKAHEPEPFRPVMRTGSQRSTVSPLGEMEYQPFSMNPRIRTGTVLRPTQVHTAPAWTIAVLPAVAAVIVAAVAFLLPEMYTPFTLIGLALVVFFSTIVLAVADRRLLVLADHTRTASPAWVLLSPPAYLLARAVRTHEQAGRGWVPFMVALPVLLVSGAVILLMPALTTLT